MFDENYKFGRDEIWRTQSSLEFDLIMPTNSDLKKAFVAAAENAGVTLEQGARDAIQSLLRNPFTHYMIKTAIEERGINFDDTEFFKPEPLTKIQTQNMAEYFNDTLKTPISKAMMDEYNFASKFYRCAPESEKHELFDWAVKCYIYDHNNDALATLHL